MADPIARLEWMGRQVVCYLQPGCNVADKSALADNVAQLCATCSTESEFEAGMEAIAKRYDLRVARLDPSVVSDPRDRLQAWGFLPPS